MEERVLSIGSVIKKDSKQAMIVGYSVIKNDGSYKPAYMVVPHPMGYTGNNSVKLISQKNVEVICEGYTVEHSEVLLKSMEKINEMILKIPQSE